MDQRSLSCEGYLLGLHTHAHTLSCTGTNANTVRLSTPVPRGVHVEVVGHSEVCENECQPSSSMLFGYQQSFRRRIQPINPLLPRLPGSIAGFSFSCTCTRHLIRKIKNKPSDAPFLLLNLTHVDDIIKQLVTIYRLSHCFQG